MKLIQLKRVEMITSQGMSVLDYKTQFIAFLEFVPDGATVNELASLVSVANKLKRANSHDQIELDNIEWTTLKSRVEATRFTVVTQEVIDMISAVTNAVEV